MKSVKRGMLLVVVLVILMSFSGFAEWITGSTACTGPTCVSLWFSCESCVADWQFGEIFVGPINCDEEDSWCGSFSINEPGELYGVDECKAHGEYLTPPQDRGCWVLAGEEDDGVFGGDDDCGAAKANPGAKWGHGATLAGFYGFGETPDSGNRYFDYRTWLGSPPNPEELIAGFYVGNAWEYICSDDKLWHTCVPGPEDDPDKFVDTIAWANNKLYECTNDNYIYKWVELESDEDHDGWTTKDGDCKDNPAYYPEICSEIEVVLAKLPGELKKEQKGSEPPELTIEAVRDHAKSLCEGELQYSQCAICINPGAPEVCGDKVNNDCGGPDASFPEDLGDLKGETYDDCNEYEEGCIQDKVFVGEKKQEEKQVRKCSLSDAECETDDDCKGDTNEEEDVCPTPPEPTGYSKPGKNIYDAEFSWIDSAEEGGFCCGYNGVDDLGTVLTQKEGKGSFICLNKELAKAEKGAQDKGIDQVFEENNKCQGDWCLVNALVGAAKFKIFTLQKPGQPAFDVVSNAEEWFVCSEQGEKTLTEPSPFVDDEGGIPGEFQAISNRFRCYQEGNRWSWAECTANDEKRKNPTIKGRYKGEGLYTLPLPIAESPSDESNEGYIREDLVGPSVPISYKAYKNFYPGKFLDFSGYDYLNFMVKFVDDEKDPNGEHKDAELKDLKLPLEITLKIEGPEKETLFEENVLGYALNSPFFDSHNFMHVRVPLQADYRGVRGVTIKASKDNFIKVRNVYLSKEGENLLCSGQNAYDTNSWIDNVDSGNPNKEISGENICKTVYGETAWLGNDEEIDEGADSANCCGNNLNEYYAGSSKECDPTDEACQKGKRYGCWNSQSLASGQTIMNVEFNVNAYEPEYAIAYDNIVLKNFVSVKYRFLKPDAVEPYGAESYQASSRACTDPPTLKVGESSKFLCEFALSDTKPSSQIFGFISSEYLQGKTEFSLDKIDHELVDVFFYDEITNRPLGETIRAAEAARLWNHPLAVVMVLRGDKYFPLKDPSGPVSISKKITRSINYSCSEPECLFPLPGSPPYQITNKHPELYELYFVTAEDETLIAKKDQSFGAYGNIKAKKVSRQVLFYNHEDDPVNLPGFYGCQAADFIRDNPLVQAYFKDKLSCAVVDGMFCSPSQMVRPLDDPKEWYTIINSWSSDKIEKVGYNTEGFSEPAEEQKISEYYLELELTLKDEPEPYTPEKRNHAASILPARNLISNAEFTTSGKEIPHWEIFKSGGEYEPVEYERKYVKETGKVVLGYGEKLRSERLAVPPAANLHFNQARECKVEVSLVDKDGKPTGDASNLKAIQTGQASYALIEFTGPGDIEKPILQLVDEFGPAEYSKKPLQEMPDTFDARAGVACCPDSFCWNGYACVEPMTKFTTLTEHIADGRDYRCIEGQWKRAVFKFDWNNQKWGFCPQDDQCFVLSSGSTENKAGDFYQGEYPLCIGNSEYIFDNYCQKGNWTSRTKFVATKLLEVAENNEFVLYCSPYNDTLLDLENKENYLAGDKPQAQQPKPDQPLGKKEQKVLGTCYQLDATGEKLIPDDQNTCINNICVLKYKDGGKFKVAFATTLNRPIDDPKSFLFSLNLPKDACKGIQNGDFMECDLSGLELSGSTDLYYSKDLNAVIYAKEGIKLSQGVVDKVLKWFDKLFGGLEPSEEKQFIGQAQIFRDLYVLNKDGKKVRALQEIFPGVRQTLVAEYKNFKTPVCDYVQNIKVPPDLETELLEKVTGVEKISCSVNGTVQNVAVVTVNAGPDFFWPQLTGRLRVNE